MVMSVHNRWFAVMAAILLCWLAGPAAAEVTARVDRADVELNESFTLELISDGTIDVHGTPPSTEEPHSTVPLIPVLPPVAPEPSRCDG